MPFSRERLEEVRSGIDRALTSGVLNDWERTFLADMRDRLERYGTRTALSDKQYKLLMKLSGAERTAGKVVPLSSAREPTSAPPRRQGIRRSQIGWTYLRRAMRRAIRRFVVLVIAVVVLFAVVTLIDRRQPFLPESFGPPSSTESRYSKSVKARQIRVIDGDTVKVQGEVTERPACRVQCARGVLARVQPRGGTRQPGDREVAGAASICGEHRVREGCLLLSSGNRGHVGVQLRAHLRRASR